MYRHVNVRNNGIEEEFLTLVPKLRCQPRGVGPWGLGWGPVIPWGPCPMAWDGGGELKLLKPSGNPHVGDFKTPNTLGAPGRRILVPGYGISIP